MGKARKMGALSPYTPNSKVEMRKKPKLFERWQQIYDGATIRSERQRQEKELKELERMKREAMNG